jgi:hypothetical protein
VSLGGEDELARLVSRLKAQDSGEAQRRYANAIRAASGPIEAQLRSAALGVRVTSARAGSRVSRSHRHNLRQRVAGAVGHRNTRRGLRFIVRADQVDERYGASLPRYLDGELRGWRRWRHPVFGDTETWVQQAGSPWFFTTIRKASGRVEAKILDAMDGVIHDITGV